MRIACVDIGSTYTKAALTPSSWSAAPAARPGCCGTTPSADVDQGWAPASAAAHVPSEAAAVKFATSSAAMSIAA